MSDLDSLTALLLMPLARHADFCVACIRLGEALAEHPGCPPSEGFIPWQDPVGRAWLLAMVQEPGGCLLQ